MTNDDQKWIDKIIRDNPKVFRFYLLISLALIIGLCIAILIPGAQVEIRELIKIDTRKVTQYDTVVKLKFDTIKKYDTIRKTKVINVREKVNPKNYQIGDISNKDGNLSFNVGDNNTINNYTEKPITLTEKEVEKMNKEVDNIINEQNLSKPYPIIVEYRSDSEGSYKKAVLIFEMFFNRKPKDGEMSTIIDPFKFKEQILVSYSKQYNAIRITAGTF